MSHTPTPWAYVDHGQVDSLVNREYSPRFEIFPLVDKTLSIAMLSTCNDNPQANAAFIVRACNAHDALVAALEYLLREYGIACDDFDEHGKPDLDFNTWDEVIVARAAINKARGQA